MLFVKYVRKATKTSFKAKTVVSTSIPLKLLHIDFFEPMKIASINGKKYGLVISNDYSRWTWVKFLKHKAKSHSVFSTLYSPVQTEMNCKIVKVRSDHDGEFENKHFENLFDSNGISHDFSCPRTP